MTKLRTKRESDRHNSDLLIRAKDAGTMRDVAEASCARQRTIAPV